MVYASNDVMGSGSKVKLLMNKKYVKDHEKNEEVGTGKDVFGEFQQFQIRDTNRGGHERVSFFYLRIHSGLTLCPGMVVTVKDILGVYKRGPYTTITCTIEEKSPTEIEDIEYQEGENGEVGVTL